MPPPGDLRAAQMHVRMRDVLWDAFYAPLAGLVAYVADRLNKVQFLSIRAYLTLVFGALVALLTVLAVWQ
jgi:hydrogenase-4 component B